MPKRLQTKRFAYFGAALIMLFSTLSYSIFFKKTPTAKAATIGTSSSSSASSSNASQRRTVVSSNGTILAFMNNGTESPTGLAYSKSTDNGATWSALAQVDSTQHSDFSIAIDGSDNVYVVSRDSSAIDAQVRKLTHSGGSWSVGSANSISGSGVNGLTVAATHDGKVWVGTNDNNYLETYYSSNLTSWTALTSLDMTVGSYAAPLVAVGNSVWTIDYNGNLFMSSGSNAAWQKAAYFNTGASTPSLSYGLDKLHILYRNGSSIYYANYDIASATASSTTTISSDANDLHGGISTDSQNIWVFYHDYVAANSYNVVYKRFNGTAWDGSATAITTDNLNNLAISTPERVNNTANLTIIWNTGTSSPYTIKSGTISTVGTVTDTGNQTGAYSGTFSGSNGDTIVKCGTWYYDTINIVAGMTVKVCSSNGVTGGTLTLYANSVTVAGTIDGAARGLPGGVAIYGDGGVGGAGGTNNPESSGLGGSAGTSVNGESGIGNVGGSGGNGGTNATPGGASGSNGLDVEPGGGGGGGDGTSATSGTSGSAGGYITAGANGDSSTDESLVQGSGGGGGGSGGSGAGGGGGGYALSGTNGGAGGNGGKGGYGGKGGNGGAIVKIFSTGSVNVSGNILSTGQTGTSGGGGQSGQNGTEGVAPACGGC